MIIAPGFDNILQSVATADDIVAGLPESIDEPDEANALAPFGDDAPFSVDDELYVQSMLAYPVNWETSGDIVHGSALGVLFAHEWVRKLRTDFGADTFDNNVTRLTVPDADEAADCSAATTFRQAQHQLTDGEDNNGDPNGLVDNASEGDDMVFRRLFTTCSTGDVWGRDHPVGSADYPLKSYVDGKELAAGVGATEYEVYDLARIPINLINFGYNFFTPAAGVSLDAGTGPNETLWLLRDLYEAAADEGLAAGAALSAEEEAAGLVVNLIDAFDQNNDGAGKRRNEGVSVMIVDTATALDPVVLDLKFGGDNVVGGGDTERVDREKFFVQLNTAMSNTNRRVVFGYEDRLPKITQIYRHNDLSGTGNVYLAVEIYNPEPFEQVDLTNWQLAIFSAAGVRAIAPLTFVNGDLLAAGAMLVIGNNAYCTVIDPTAKLYAGMTFTSTDYVALIRRFAPSTVSAVTLETAGSVYHGVVVDMTDVPALADDVLEVFNRIRGWRCDQWHDFGLVGDPMPGPPPVDDCYPKVPTIPPDNVNVRKLELYFPDDPTTKMPNLGAFGRVVDFQLAHFRDETYMGSVPPDVNDDTMVVPDDTLGKRPVPGPGAAFSRNVAEALEDNAPTNNTSTPAWDERWAVFYQFAARDVTGASYTSREPSSVRTLMELVTVPAPHADGLDNDGDGAIDLADTGSQPGDRYGPEVRVPGQINVNTAGEEVLGCLVGVTGLLLTDPILARATMAQAYLNLIRDRRPYTRPADFLDGSNAATGLDLTSLSVETNGIDDDGDGYIDEPNEELFLRARLINLTTTRSNTFLVYLATRYVDEGARRLAIVAGANGTCDTTVTAGTDDIQVVAPTTTGLRLDEPVILPGPNRLIDTAPGAGSDDYINVGINEPLDTGNALVDTTTAVVNDDVRLVAAGDMAPPGTCIIHAGLNGLLETAPEGDEQGPGQISELWAAGNGTCDTTAAGDDVQIVASGDPAAPGQVVVGPGSNGVLDTTAGGDDVTITPNGAMCIREGLAAAGTCSTTAVGDDIQVVANTAGTTAGQVVVLPGPNGRLDTVPGADDQYDYNAMFAEDDSVYVKREILILDRAACVRSGATWIPQVRVLGRRTLSEYRKVPR